MRLLSLRLIVSLILGITLVSTAFSYYEVIRKKQSLRSEVQRRAEELSESLASAIEQSWDPGDPPRELQRLVKRFGSREHLLGIVVLDHTGKVLAISPGLNTFLANAPLDLPLSMAKGEVRGQFLRLAAEPVHLMSVPLHDKGEIVGGLAVVHDVAYIRAESMRVWRESFLRVLAQVFFIVLITVVIVRWSITGPIARAAKWMRALRTDKAHSRHEMPDLEILKPLAREFETLAKSLTQARTAAEQEARLREAGARVWTAERLSVQVSNHLEGSRLFVVSNREPYMHQRNGKSIDVVVPPSGLVTALEPILTACDGTWIAQGSGDADFETVDSHDRLRVPPDDPHYTLRRVWLSKEEEEGYYYGFANEGLWPLCHIAHTRPIFRAQDWKYYEEVNQKFAATVLQEIEHVSNPVILVQDYHFALLPRLIKERRPEARVAIFWHIPWPNPEAFAICPWQLQLIDGLLGADLIGFHIQSHCNNFLQTVDRVVESRVDWEHFSVMRRDHSTIVRPFPISVSLSAEEVEVPPTWEESSMERAALLRKIGVEAIYLGVGVDRVDYTKGILERFLAVERFLEKWPSYQGKFTFVQIGAPSRTHIKRYHDLLVEVESEAQRINQRFQSAKWKPIVFLKGQHSHKEIIPFYKAADLCLVTSLHDGMNLVAKEFLAARNDERGVLILSQFTGAARELRDALLINPYDIDQTADAIRTALEMQPEDKQMRVQRMRKTIEEHNIYRWAGTLISELCELRLDQTEESSERSRATSAVS
ncbi:MAG: trehalose-6-phosphate synthase [Acidobacteria bacterium]|nr:trehalose-6-phosphate synthase [Acidobacteriota bacterium]